MSPFRSKLGLFTGITCGHFIATGAALLATFGASMSRFDSDRAPTLFESVIEAVFRIFSFPVLPLIHDFSIPFPGFWGYVPFAVNSALWSFAVCLILAVVRKRKNA